MQRQGGRKVDADSVGGFYRRVWTFVVFNVLLLKCIVLFSFTHSLVLLYIFDPTQPTASEQIVIDKGMFNLWMINLIIANKCEITSMAIYGHLCFNVFSMKIAIDVFRVLNTNWTDFMNVLFWGQDNENVCLQRIIDLIDFWTMQIIRWTNLLLFAVQKSVSYLGTWV